MTIKYLLVFTVVSKWQPNIDQHAVGYAGGDDGGERLAAVMRRLALEKVVLARVARELELRSQAEPRTGLLRLFARGERALQVAVKIHGPLV